MGTTSLAIDTCSRGSAPLEAAGISLDRVTLRSLPSAVTHRAFRESAARQLMSLTPRQSLVLDHILAGSPSKTIAFNLHISQRTVENHRAAIAKKMGARSLSALLHTAICGRCFLSGGCGVIDAGGMTSTCSKALPLTLLEAAPLALPLVKPCDEIASLGIAMAEIQHRLKTIVAVVQSLTNQTMRQSATKEEFAERITARLGAYCRSLDLLTSAKLD